MLGYELFGYYLINVIITKIRIFNNLYKGKACKYDVYPASDAKPHFNKPEYVSGCKETQFSWRTNPRSGQIKTYYYCEGT